MDDSNGDRRTLETGEPWVIWLPLNCGRWPMKWFVEKERDKPYASGARQVSIKLLFLTECLEYELTRQVVNHFIQTNVPDDSGNSSEQIGSDSHRGYVRWYENMTCLYLNWFVYELTCDSFIERSSLVHKLFFPF